MTTSTCGRSLRFARAGACFALCAGINASLSADQWVQTAGPSGGRIRDLAAAGDVLYAAAGSSGIYRQESGTWTALAQGLPASAIVREVMPVGGDVFALIHDGAILRLNEATDAWEETAPLPVSGGAYHLHRRSDRIVVHVDSPGGMDALLESSDAGETWQSIPLPVPNTSSVLVLDHLLLVTEDFDGVFRSVDDGASWEEADAGLPQDFHSLLAANDSALLLRTVMSQQLFRSLDDGLTWSSVSGPPFQQNKIGFGLGSAFFIISPSPIGGPPVVHRSLDDGLTWQTLAGSGLPGQGAQPSAMDHQQDDLLLATTQGVFRSGDLAESWSDENDGLTATEIEVVTGGVGVVIAGSFFGPPNFVTVDAGETWAGASEELANVVPASSLVIDDDSLFVGTNGTGVLRSDDGGVTWQFRNTGLPTYGSLVGELVEPMNGFAELEEWIFAATGGGSEFVPADPHCGCSTVPSGDGVYRTSNGGASWQRASTGLPIRSFHLGEPILRPINDVVAIDGALLAATTGFGIYRSTNLGMNWSNSSSGLAGGGSTPFLETVDFVLIDETVYVLTWGRRIFASSDTGLSWQEIENDLPPETVLGNMVLHDGSLFASGDGFFSQTLGVWRSDDGGSTWSLSGSPIDEIRVTDLHAAGATILASTRAHGVWRMENGPDPDIDGDGVVGFGDLLMVLSAWGPCRSGSCPADVDGDGTVGFEDLLIVLSAWG